MIRLVSAVFLVVLIWAAPAQAACVVSSCTSGQVGTVKYQDDAILFCNGTNFIDFFAASCGGGTEVFNTSGNTTLSISPSSKTGMNATGTVVNGTFNASGNTTFTVTNTGDEYSTKLKAYVYTSVGSGLDASQHRKSNFEITTDNCSGVSLAPGATCTVLVRARAGYDHAYTGTLFIMGENYPTASLSGTSSGTGSCVIETDAMEENVVYNGTSRNYYTVNSTACGNPDCSNYVSPRTCTNGTMGPGGTYSDCINPLGSCKVICTELKNQGLMSLATYKADTDFSREHITLAAIKVYHWWGKPVARWMAESSLLTGIMEPLGNAWAEHLAYAMGERDEDNKLGWFLRHTFLPIHEFIGRMVYKDDIVTEAQLEARRETALAYAGRK